VSEDEHAENEGTTDPDEEGIESIPASDELEAALKEAEQAVDQRQTRRTTIAEKVAGKPDTADKMTIEMLSHELQSLKTEHETTLTSLAETDDKFLRLQAEFDNFRRRTLKEKQDTFKYGHQNLVKDLLPSVDNLERAVVHGEGNQDGDFESLLQGVELVQRELLGALAKHGVEPIQTKDQIFDPAVHEAMAQIPVADVPLNTVVQVLQTGYLLRDRMLRAARVVVSKPVESAEEQGDASQRETQQGDGDAPYEEEP
jgi:molecular chaperone GrpE